MSSEERVRNVAAELRGLLIELDLALDLHAPNDIGRLVMQIAPLAGHLKAVANDYCAFHIQACATVESEEFIAGVEAVER